MILPRPEKPPGLDRPRYMEHVSSFKKAIINRSDSRSLLRMSDKLLLG